MFNRVATPDPRSVEPIKSLTPQAVPQLKTQASPLFGTAQHHHSGPAVDAPTAEWVIGITMTTTGLLSVGTALSRWYTAYRALVAPAPVAEAAAPTPEPVRPIPISAGADLRRPVEQH